MKSLKYLFTVCLFSLSTVLFAHNVGDHVDYELIDGGRLITGGHGTLRIVEKTNEAYALGVGYVLQMDFDMTAAISGQQKGHIKVFVPGNLLDDIHDLDSARRDYGAFTLAQTGTANIDGKLCEVISVTDVQHPFGADKGQSKVLEVVNSGSLDKITDIKVELKVHNVQSEKLLKALTVKVEGKAGRLLRFGATFKKK